MKKKILWIIMIGLLLVGCSKESDNKNKETINSDAIKFKEEYESLNGKETSYGVTNRTVSIDENNMVVYVSAEEIVNMIKDGKSFYVYFGSNKCPWCRSVIEKALEMADNNGIDKLYYVDIWDEDGNEILRDKYVINDNGELEQTIKGTTAYYELLEVFDEYLDEYTLTDENGKEIKVGEKRIFAPNFVYITNGKVKSLTTGISAKQTGAFDELNGEILEDEGAIFNTFFASHLACQESLC